MKAWLEPAPGSRRSLNNLLRGKVEEFSLNALVNLAAAARRRLEIWAEVAA